MRHISLTYGDIVVIAYPFSDLQTFKKRPCVVLKELGEDIVAVFISSRIEKKSKDDILLKRSSANNLVVDSLIKVWKINTVHKKLIRAKIGTLDDADKVKLKGTLLKFIKEL